jgi:hypothetical protein
MNKFLGLAIIVAAATALFAAGASAQMKVPSGDTCASTPTGTSGTSYTLNIVTGAGTQQYGLAVGAPGITIQNISISGTNGNFTTSNLPANTSGAWMSDAALTGTLSATLTFTGTPTGSFMIMPAAQQGSSFYDTISCTATTRPLRKSISFSVTPKAVYSTKAHAWHVMVKVPTAGIVSAKQALITSPNTPKTLKPKAAVTVHRVQTKTGGTVMLTLKPTTAGLATLATKSAIKLQLNIQFDAHDGQNGHKLVQLTLRK